MLMGSINQPNQLYEICSIDNDNHAQIPVHMLFTFNVLRDLHIMMHFTNLARNHAQLLQM